MKDEKEGIGAIVATILAKKGKPDKEDYTQSEDTEESQPRQVIAQDLIDALRAGNPDGVIAALDAFCEASMSGYATSHREDDPDCGTCR